MGLIMDHKDLPKGQFLPGAGMEYLRQVAIQMGIGNSPMAQKIRSWFGSGHITPGKLAKAERLLLHNAIYQNSQRAGRDSSEPTAHIGTLRDGQRWGPKLRALCEHVVIAGASGAGKSMLALLLMHAIARATKAAGCVVHFLAFDFKRDIRRFIRLLAGFLVVRKEHLRLNIFENPPRVPLRDWAQILGDFLAEVFGLRASTKFMLVQLVDDLYAAFDSEKTREYPCLLDLNDLVKARIESTGTPAAEKGKLWTLLNKTDPICRRIPDVVGVSRGFSIEDILANDAVFELDGLANDIQKFIVTAIRTQAFHYYLSNGKSDARLKTCVFVDEAGQTMAKDSREGPTTEKTTMRMSRSVGLAHIVAHQMLKDIAEDVRANASIQILKKLNYAPDIREAKASLGLPEELSRLLPCLPVNMAIIKGNEESGPFELMLDDLPEELMTPLGEEELNQRNPSVMEVLGRNVSPRVLRPIIPATQEKVVTKHARSFAPKVNPVEDWPRLLRFVHEHPGLGVVEAYAGMGLKTATGDRLKRQWLTNGLVTLEAEKPHGPGKPKAHLRLTDKGIQYLAHGVAPDKLDGEL